jgi:hypothetical protein
MRYCGSKHDHKPHNWQQLGRPNGPIFTCPGKPRQEIPLDDPMQLDLLADRVERNFELHSEQREQDMHDQRSREAQRSRMRDV